MALKTFVKISSVNNLSDARYCSGMQVNLMGFNLEESNKNYTSPEKFKEITAWLSGLEFVGEFELNHPERILTVIKDYPEIQHIQIQEEIHLKMLVNTGLGLIYKNQISTAEDLDELILKAPSFKDHGVKLLLVSADLEIDGEIKSKIKSLAEICQVLLGFGFSADTVEELIKETGVQGIEMEGGEEIKPGLKDFDELAEILEALEVED
ncbi:phosphoribosylanthranilate isomerase [Shivajiella indica]|uniref:phosphoribosylanthranilate isomerase n=1 Tax=Shivajiella indica TaxID=872115 RepID=A0ABW5B458_9BACT